MKKRATKYQSKTFLLPAELCQLLATTASVESTIRQRRVTQTEVLVRALLLTLNPSKEPTT